MGQQRQSGFTLVELVVTMAVMAILLGVGVPSFVDVMKNSRMSSQYNALVGSLYLARSEAVKSARFVTVCARASDSSCGDDWNNGWLVYVDNAPNHAAATPTIAGTDEVLTIDPESSDDIAITAFGSSDGTSSNATSGHFVRYQPNGSTTWTNGYFRLCDAERGETHSRAVNIALTGDIRRARLNADGKPINVFNEVISC